METNPFAQFVQTPTLPAKEKANPFAGMVAQPVAQYDLSGLFQNPRDPSEALPSEAKSEFLDPATGTSTLTRSAAVLAWASHKMPKIGFDELRDNFDGIRPVMAKQMFGVDNPTITNDEMYSLIKNNYDEQGIHLTEEWNKASPVKQMELGMKAFTARVGYGWEKSWKTFSPLVAPTAAEILNAATPNEYMFVKGSNTNPIPIPHIPSMGMADPAIIAPIWDGIVKPFWDSTMSPAGLGLIVVTGGLSAEARAGSIVAARAMSAISGLFGLQMGYVAAKAAPETLDVLRDPNASFHAKATAVMGEFSAVFLAGVSAWHGVSSTLETNRVSKVLTSIEGKTPVASIAILRDHAAKATSASEKEVLTNVADHLHRLNEAVNPTPKDTTAFSSPIGPEQVLNDVTDKPEFPMGIKGESKPAIIGSGLDKKETKLGNLLGQSVNYAGYIGTLIRDDEGNFVVRQDSHGRKFQGPQLVEIADTGKDPEVLADKVGVIPSRGWTQEAVGNPPAEITKSPDGSFVVTDGDGKLVKVVPTHEEAVKVATETDTNVTSATPSTVAADTTETGITHGAIDEARATRGEGTTPAPKTETVTDEDARAGADEAFKKDPNAGKKLTQKLRDNPDYIPTKEEKAVLAKELGAHTADEKTALADVTKAESQRLPGAVKDANAKLMEVVARLREVEALIERAGSLTGRSLQGQQAVADNSFSGVLRAVAGDKAPTTDQVAMARSLHAGLWETLKKVDEHRARIEAEEANTPRNRFLKAVSKRGQQALLDWQRDHATTVHDITDIPALAAKDIKNLTMIMAGKIAEGITQYGPATAAMMADFGPVFEKVAKQVYDAAQHLLLHGDINITPTHGLKILNGIVKRPDFNNPMVKSGPNKGLQTSSKVIQVAQYLHDNAPAFFDYNKHTPEERAKLVDDFVAESLHALAIHPNAAGWYDANVKLAMAIMEQADPTLKKPANAFIFKAILAVTSDGNEVGENFKMAYNEYVHWRDNKSFSGEHVSGTRLESIKSNIQLLPTLIEGLGGEVKAQKWLMVKETLGEVRESAKRDMGFTNEQAGAIGSGEKVDSVVPRSVMFGPKLGSFFANLHGDYSTLTMDLWFMRLYGRLTGNLIEKATPEVEAASRKDLARLIGKMSDKEKAKFQIDQFDISTSEGIDAAAKKAKGLTGSEEFRDSLSKNGNEYRLATKRHIDTVLEPIIEEPGNGSRRAWIREVMTDVQTKLAERRFSLEHADIQALLWYQEKELYEALGYKAKSKTADYASSAAAVHESILGRPSELYASAAGRVGEIGKTGVGDAGAAGSGGAAKKVVRARNRDTPEQSAGKFLSSFLSRKVAEARADMKQAAREGRLLAASPKDMMNLVFIAADDIAKGAKDIAAWSADAIKRFGPDIKDSIPTIWQRANDLLVADRQNAAYQRRTMGRIAELDEMLQSGNVEVKPRNKMTMDDGSRRLQAELNRKRSLIEAERTKRENQGAHWADRAAKVFSNVQVSFKIGGYHTFGKILSYDMQNIPGIREAYRASDHEGSASMSSVGAFYKKSLTEGIPAAWQQLIHGHNEFRDAYEAPSGETLTALEYISGNLHTAEKLPLRIGTFGLLLDKAEKQAVAHGLDPSNEFVRVAIAKKAWDYSARSILQENNIVAQWAKGLGDRARQTDSPSIRALATILESMTTGRIYKVPANYVWQTIERSPLGLAKAAADYAMKPKGVKMTPEQADVSARLITAGMVGSAFFFTGLVDGFNDDDERSFGGYFSKGMKRSNRDVPVGQIRVGNVILPHILIHNPLFESAQMGATLGRWIKAAHDKHPDEDPALLEGAVSAAFGLVQQSPVIGTVIRADNDIQQWVRDIIKSAIVPQIIDNAARDSDKDRHGDTIQRKTPDVKSTIKGGIPGLRQDLERKPRKFSFNNIQRNEAGRISSFESTVA
jgi:hypothetical protein